MTSNDALDLSSIDPPVWRIMVGEVAYGPYTLGQMRSFAEEGRLLASSRVARGDGGAFTAAFEYRPLRDLFAAEADEPPPVEQSEAANFMISVRTDSDGRSGVISLLNQVGRFSELMPGTFILHAEISLVALHGQLSTILAERGKFVLANTKTGQLAWMGLGPDADHHARAIWKRES